MSYRYAGEGWADGSKEAVGLSSQEEEEVQMTNYISYIFRH